MAEDAFAALASAFRILLNGRPAPDGLHEDVSLLRVAEERGRPARFVLRLRDGARAWSGRPDWRPGAQVEVQLGTAGRLCTVAVGQVSGWDAEVSGDGSAHLDVVCHDPLHRLSLQAKTRTFTGQTDSDIVRAVLLEHGRRAQCEDSAVVHPFVLQHGMSDLDFLQARAASCAFVLRARDGTVQFRRESESELPAACLRWGETIGRLSHETNTYGQTSGVEARGWDDVSGAPVSARAGDGGDARTVLTTLSSVDELEARAKAEHERRADGRETIECSADGDPAIHEGVVVGIEGVAARIDGRYRVLSVTHRFAAGSGYVTEFRARRVRPRG